MHRIKQPRPRGGALNASTAEAPPLHICLVTPAYPPQVGGLSRCAHDLAHGLVERGHRVQVLVGHPEAARSETDSTKVNGLNVVWLKDLPVHRLWEHIPGANDVRRSTAVLRVLRRAHLEEPFDVVEFASWRALGTAHMLLGPVPQLLRSTTGIAEVPPETGAWGARVRDRLGRAVLRASEQICLRRSDLVIVPTQAHRQRLPRGVRRAAVVMPFGMPLPQGSAHRSGTTVLYVGRLSYRKGFDLFAKAADLLLSKSPDSTVIVVGADFVDLTGSTWVTHGLPVQRRYPDRFIWHGEVDDETLDRLYWSSDVCAVPSRYESFGLVFVEANIRGLTVVAWDIPVVREVCGDAAVLSPPWDVNAFARALHTALMSASLHGKEERIRAVTATKYSMDTYLQRSEHVYRIVAAQRAAARRLTARGIDIMGDGRA